MRDVPDDEWQQPPQRPIDYRTMKRGMTNASPDDEPITVDAKPVELGNAVDVDEVAGSRHSKSHGWNKALTTGQHTAIVRCHVGENCHRLGHRPGRVISE